jgi:tetratricopeptide (TPR) repeat protein
LIHKLLLLVIIAPFVFPASNTSSQEPVAASRQSFDQLLLAAEKARDENRDGDAIRLFRRAVSEQPESEQALWYLGTLLYEKQQYTGARDVLRQFVTLRSDAGPAWALLGLCEFQLRAYPHALDYLQRAMAQGMGDRKELIQSVYFNVVVLLTRFERYDESIDMLQRMLANGAADPALAEPAGLAGLRLPLLPSEIPPDRRELVHLAGRAVLDVQTQHYEDAESELKQLVTNYANEPGVHYLYGAYLEQLHPNESVTEFERELEISPSHVLARVRLAEQLIAQHDLDRALALAQQAIKLEPKRASAHMVAGEALHAKGNGGDGIKELETARDIDPKVVRAHWDLLRAYLAAGRKQDADKEKQAIEKLSNRNSQGGPKDAGDTPHNQSAP